MTTEPEPEPEVEPPQPPLHYNKQFCKRSMAATFVKDLTLSMWSAPPLHIYVYIYIFSPPSVAQV